MNAGTPSLGRLLIVDDEAAQMKALCDTLKTEGYETRGFTSAKRALAALDEEHFDVVLTDLVMPYMDGIALIEAARQRDPDLVGVVMTGHGTIDTAVRAMQTGAMDYILKPFRLKVVLPVLERALTLRRLQIENRELTRRVDERTRELEIANEELESFSYSISHDLRTPLLTVHGFAQVFLEQHAAGVSAEARELLEKMLAGAVRMNELIHDLLELSRVGRQALRVEVIEMEALAGQVAADLSSRESGRKIDVMILALPACRGDRSLVEQILVNLLSNAFKFTRRAARARIEVGFEEGADEGEVVYFVKDNGAGFDMQHADKPFGAFQRLHSASEFEGTGIGLSIVERIVHRHGGRVWAESRPEKGATFHFTLPRGR